VALCSLHVRKGRKRQHLCVEKGNMFEKSIQSHLHLQIWEFIAVIIIERRIKKYQLRSKLCKINQITLYIQIITIWSIFNISDRYVQLRETVTSNNFPQTWILFFFFSPLVLTLHTVHTNLLLHIKFSVPS
jgi:hypothetical protein